MVIGDPISHSLSPNMHNAGYRALGIEDQFVYVACQVAVKDIPDFIKGVRVMGIRGVSCTAPHKEKVLPYLDDIDAVAKKIGAVNTIVNDNGRLIGYNTDWLGVLHPLAKITSLQGKKVALIGAGGAAKGIAYGLAESGAHISIFNRTLETAKALAKQYGGEFFSLDNIDKVKNMDIIINATTLGTRNKEDLDNENKSPVHDYLITNKHIVFDAVYKPCETKLLRYAKAQGATVIHGTEMLLHQGAEQFKLYTGFTPPIDAMAEALHQYLI